MLRDLITRLHGAGTWPCDEINYVWRHGNIRVPSDALQPQMARPEVKRYIGKCFDRLASSRNLDTVVEKTCANSLRVPFVDEAVPDAKYVFIIRDGMDAAASALKRWHASLGLVYVLRKARFVPLADLPFYGRRFVANHLHRITSKDRRVKAWGPILEGMAELVNQYPMIGVCGVQWQSCVEMAASSLQRLPGNRVCRVRYEELLLDPVKEFSRIADFAGKVVPDSFNEYLVSHVNTTKMGAGRAELSSADRDLLKSLIGRTLASYGYA